MSKENVNTRVWMRVSGDKWVRVTLVPMSQNTAETLATLLTVEHGVTEDDHRFCASGYKPRSAFFQKHPRDDYFEALNII